MTPKTRNLGRLILCALCLVGATVSGVLVRAHAGSWPGTPPSSALPAYLCGGQPGAESDCVKVLRSDWSAFDVTIPVVTSSYSIAWRRVVVPVAFVGLAYFMALGVWFAFAGHPVTWGRWYAVPMLVVAVGASASAVLLGIMLTRLDSRCALCQVTHAINGLLVVGMLLLLPPQRAASNTVKVDVQRSNTWGHRKGSLALSTVFRMTGFAVIVIMGLWMYRGAKLETRQHVAKLLPYKEFVDQRTNDPAFLVREFYAQPKSAIHVASQCVNMAPSEEVPKLTVFTDFQCPACACFAHKWETEYSPSWIGPIRVELRHLPLGTKCNDSMASNVHPEACDASYAAEAARLQGGDAAFGAMHDRLFASIGLLHSKPYATLATEIGLNGARLLADMDQASVREVVARDIALGERLGVHETPAAFLNGRRVPNYYMHNRVFWGAISADLRRTTVSRQLSADDTEYARP